MWGGGHPRFSRIQGIIKRRESKTESEGSRDLSVVTHTCNHTTRTLWRGGSRTQGHPWLHSKLETSLGFIDPIWKIKSLIERHWGLLGGLFDSGISLPAKHQGSTGKREQVIFESSGLRLMGVHIQEMGIITSVKLKKRPTPPRIFRALSECLRNFSPHNWHTELLVLHI